MVFLENFVDGNSDADDRCYGFQPHPLPDPDETSCLIAMKGLGWST